MAKPSLVPKKMVRCAVTTKGPGSKALGKCRCNRKRTRGALVVGLTGGSWVVAVSSSSSVSAVVLIISSVESSSNEISNTTTPWAGHAVVTYKDDDKVTASWTTARPPIGVGDV